MKRFLFILLAALVALPSMAKKNVYEGFDIYGLETANKFKKNTFALDLGIGQEFKAGIRLQHNFNLYVAWDILAFKYTYDWSEENWYYEYRYGYGETLGDNAHEIALTTGIRGFTPAFISGKLKGVASLAFGYGHSWNNVKYRSSYWGYYNDGDIDGNHCAIDLTAGLQICDRIFVGYGFSAMKGNEELDKTAHTLRLSVNF